MASREIWQTTNQQPWVQGLIEGVITCKTRTSKPCVPVGAMVFLHTSKSKLWPLWKGLNWVRHYNMDPANWQRGKIIGTAIVSEVGLTADIMRPRESRHWDVDMIHYSRPGYNFNSAAQWTVRFKDILPLDVPIECRGFQAPFARAKADVIKKVLLHNPEVCEYLEPSMEEIHG